MPGIPHRFGRDRAWSSSREVRPFRAAAMAAARVEANPIQSDQEEWVCAQS